MRSRIAKSKGQDLCRRRNLLSYKLLALYNRHTLVLTSGKKRVMSHHIFIAKSSPYLE